MSDLGWGLMTIPVMASVPVSALLAQHFQTKKRKRTMTKCRNCHTEIEKTGYGWMHVVPEDHYDARICYLEAVYAEPEES